MLRKDKPKNYTVLYKDGIPEKPKNYSYPFPDLLTSKMLKLRLSMSFFNVP